MIKHFVVKLSLIGNLLNNTVTNKTLIVMLKQLGHQVAIHIVNQIRFVAIVPVKGSPSHVGRSQQFGNGKPVWFGK